MRCTVQLQFNSYSFIYSYLLSLQGEFDEDLLQFLVDKVDAKLLKTVSLRK